MVLLHVLDLAFHKHSEFFWLDPNCLSELLNQLILVIRSGQRLRLVPPVESRLEGLLPGVEGRHHPYAASVIGKFAADLRALNARQFAANQNQDR